MPNYSIPACPVCGMENTYPDGENFIYLDYSHEWSANSPSVEIEEKRLDKDAHSNILNDGDTVTLIKDLKVKGSSLVIKGSTKIKNIRLVNGDHDIDCKVDDQSMLLKSESMKKSS
jgi:protein PhnA